METLKSLLYDQKRIVTSLTLSRHANISVEEAARHLETLFMAEKDTKGLNAVYTLVGFRPGESAEPTHILVRGVELEDKKCKFESIEGESIFSLQTREIEDLYDIVTSDDVEDEKFFRSDSGRARIQSTQVSAFKKEKDEKYGAEDIIPVLQSSSTKQTAKPSPTNKGKKKEEDVAKQSLKPVKDYLPSTPKRSPAKPICDSPFSSQEKRRSLRSSEDSNSPVLPKRRTRKILLDDEEDSPPVKKETTAKSPEDSSVTTGIDKKKKGFVLDDGDLYDANGSSPDISPVKESKKKEDIEKPKTKKTAADSKISADNPKGIELRRSPRKKQQSDLPPGKKRVCRRITETYQDEDGFLVTKEVMREEIVDIPEEELEAKPLAATSKLNKDLSQDDNKKTTKKAQSKISSFFTKK